MKESANRPGRMKEKLGAAAFYGINAVLAPVTMLGYAIWVGKSILGGRDSGVSGTAQGPLSARFFQHKLGTREDEAASRLLLALPSLSPVAVRLASASLLLAHEVTGYVPKAFRYPFEGEVRPQFEASARVTFFDAALERHLPEVAQLVILGAGFDTQAFRLPRGAPVRAFEVDMPKTQAVKREVLERAGIDSSGVTFVAADFEKDDWLAKLVEAGFDPGKPSFFLWEGVTVYLERAAVLATLRKIAGTVRWGKRPAGSGRGAASRQPLWRQRGDDSRRSARRRSGRAQQISQQAVKAGSRR